MRFGLYSELQCHPWQTYEQVYGETLEQVANADRLGFDCYSIIEHWFYEEAFDILLFARHVIPQFRGAVREPAEATA